MARKKSFLLYIDRKQELDMLTDAQAGILFKAIMAYADSGQELQTDELALKLMFSVFRSQLDRNAEKYEEVCKKRSEAGKKGGRPKKEEATESKKSNCFFEKAKKADNDNVNENENENDNVNVSDNENENENDIPQEMTDRQNSKPVSFQERVFSKPMEFGVLLYNMHSPLYQEGFQSEEELSDYDTEDRFVSECTIPFTFQYNCQTLESALRYLLGYSNLQNQEFQNFSASVIQALSEAVTMGKASCSQSVDPQRLISRINEINSSPDSSFAQWMEAFAMHYSRKLKEKEDFGQPLRNKYGYLKVCAVTFLDEYRVTDIYPGFKE